MLAATRPPASPVAPYRASQVTACDAASFPSSSGDAISRRRQRRLSVTGAGAKLAIESRSQVSNAMWIGPLPGDIAEIEAYCRIFRAAERVHAAVMAALCDPESGECSVNYDTDTPNIFEDKVASVLGRMLAALNRARANVLSGRTSLVSYDKQLPPLAAFRGEMKQCCESLQSALSSYMSLADGGGLDIWRKLGRLKNVCYDAGFTRDEEYPCPGLFANWYPVYFEDKVVEDSVIAFYRGGQVTEEGLKWLIKNGFKTIVDLRKEDVSDQCYRAALNEAVLSGNLEVFRIPVEVGMAPTMEQVQKFAAIVADAQRRPIYLHSQEGIKRTCALVSRWKQYTGRSSKLNFHNQSLNGKGKLAENGQVEDLLAMQDPCANGGVAYEIENVTLQSDVLKDTADHEQSETLAAEKNLLEQKSLQVSPLHKTIDHHSARNKSIDLLSNFSMHKNPLKAQLPSGDIFSKKEMSNFLRSKKVYPRTYSKSQGRPMWKLPVHTGNHSLPIEKSEASDAKAMEYTLPDSLNVPLLGKGAVVKAASGTVDRKPSTNGSPSSVQSELIELRSSGLSVGTDAKAPTNGTATSNGGVPDSNKKNFLLDPDAAELSNINGNMCASATGVVRLQSRRKAEMFLVRTDGFSCTRERVTESSLAFTHPSTQQQMLMWKSPPKTVLLLKKLGNALMEEAKEVASFLHHQEKMNVLVEPDVHDVFARIPGYGFVQTFYSQDTSDLHERVDFVACLGGDGVILHASNLFRTAVPPVVSFNLGSLGFLTSHTFEDYRQDLREVIHGNETVDGVYITLRMRLRCEIYRKGKANGEKVFDILNEVVVDRGSNPYLSKIECYEHDRLITKVQGDGVIVATPTGSTAYSTAAGGSMVHPNVPCMLFTPICPHSLSFRPVILPDSARLELKIPNDARNNAWVSFDGKRRQQLSKGDSVRISMSQHPLPTVNKSDQTGDWFHSLIRCLNWNERLDQKAL